MKAFLSLALVLLSLGAHAQALPVDAVTGKVTYAGIVEAPGAGADELFRRAKAFGLTSLAPPVVDEAAKTVLGIWEKQLVGKGAARVLRYQGSVSAKDGQYRYELSNFENKTMPVEFRDPASGVTRTAPGGAAPIERVLANTAGYKKGKPTAQLLDYQAAVKAAAEQAAADLQQRMKGNAPFSGF